MQQTREPQSQAPHGCVRPAVMVKKPAIVAADEVGAGVGRWERRR